MCFATSLVCVVCFLELVFYCSGSVHVAKLSPIRVELGRSVFVDPVHDLQITFPEGAICEVVVLRSDPLSQRVGFLTPDVFPCDFSLGDVQYSHLGSMFFLQDFVKLQIRVDTDNETRLIPLNLHVTVLFTDMEIVKLNRPITVEEIGGTSTINGDVLAFKQDPTKICSVTLLDIKSGVIPRYGELVNVTKGNGTSAQFECGEFLRSNISYQHTKRSSSNKDFIPLVVEMIDPNTDSITREYFQIIVRIMGARSNQRPVASFEASHSVEVSQYSIAPITSDILAASDTETEAGEIIFNITQALQSHEGSLINTDDPYQPLTAFYQRDIAQLKIAYKPPSAQSDQLRMFRVVLEAVDTEGAKSEPIRLLIMVKPTNNKAPFITKNAGLSLFEGQSRTITDQFNLAISDKDNFNDVKLQAISGLRHGELRIMGHKIDTFMATDLEIPVITYHHDNSDSYSDNIIFRMTDGKNEVKFLFPITIGPVDDTAPTLVRNTGLVLDEGDIAVIDQYMLSATDIDSEDSKILFRVVAIPNFQRDARSALYSANKVGVLCLRTKTPPEGDADRWILKQDGFFEQNVTQFSQYDITNRRLYYRHLGGEYFHDEIAFVLSDQAEVPNVSPIKTFRVTIRQIDDLPPSPFPGSPMELTADEYEQMALSQEVLRYADRDSNDDDLMFFITKEPYFINDSPNITSFAGEILFSDTNEKASKFTQLQVRHKKVTFKSPNLELGTKTRYVQFDFSVSDLSGNTIKDQTFRIALKPVNNQAPRPVVTPLKVREFSETILGKEHLTVLDEDTPRSKISFTLITVPRYGTFLKDGQEVQQSDAFTARDVETSRMSYRHVVRGEASDELGLKVDDGVQKASFLLEIVILPEKINLTSHVFNMTVRVREHSREPIKMHTTSQSPRDADLMLRISTPPRVGRILRNGKMSYEFSVQDLETGLIFYEHIGRETGLRGDIDHFNLTLLNETKAWIREGRRYEAVEVVTMIIPVDSQPPKVTKIKQLVVMEGGSAKLTSEHLTITDPDTPDDRVTCIIDVQPTVGFLEKVTPSPGSEISNRGKRVTSFTIVDIRSGHISYVQNQFKGTEPAMDRVAFLCSDGNNTSPRYLLNIEISPQNDEKPQIFTRDFVVEEGDEIIMDVTVLNAVDADVPPDELVFEVVTPPRHGMITDSRQGTPVQSFPLTQIKKSTSIVYQHDGSESTRDSFALSVSDGTYNTTRTIPVFIIPVDDEEPTLSVNVGLRIKTAGESKIITPKNLRAHDVDSPDDNITFLVRSSPRSGQLRKIYSNGSSQILGKGEMFSQKDINDRRIVYFHNAQVPDERDYIKFDLSDGQNTQLNQVFYVEISAGDRIYPTVINKGVRLAQNTRVVISTNVLSASDIGSPNEKLRYSLVKQPQKGRLEHLDFPGARLEEFTQLDLAGNKVVYVHTSTDEAKADSFDFEVSDGTNSVVRTFLVTLLDTDNKKPVLISSDLVVNEGENILITPFELRAEDQDTLPENLVYTVTRVPLHGWILNGATPSRAFTQEDVNLNKISYAHDGSEVNKDSFEIAVSDGAHNEFYVFPNTNTSARSSHRVQVVIKPVDNRVPQLVLNRGATNLNKLPGNRLGFVISNSVLRVEDLDSNNSQLIYTVIFPPSNGILTEAGGLHGNQSVNNFTQADVDSKNIMYVLHHGSNATNDAFDFEVSDPAGNTLRHQRFSLTWAWVSLERHRYEINETDGVISVVISRKGFLGEVSFAELCVRGVNATFGDDFSLLGPAHVQFSPGQSKAEFKLRVKDDGKYEGPEIVKVELNSPRMCVIKNPKCANVIITDPEDVPSVEVVSDRLVVEESVREAKIPLRRTGDISQRLYVTCVTHSFIEEGWATGTIPTSISSYADFITRPAGKESVITFEKGESTKDCPVMIIDDSLYENEETFYVTLLSHLGSKINHERNTSAVIIAPDSKDEPKIFFDPSSYIVDESVGKMQVTLRRNGTDLSKSSSVFVRSRQIDPISARASEDYTPVIQMVYFAPYFERQSMEVTIRDDKGLPRVEGTETFELVLRTPINTGIKEPSNAVIAIDDSISDLPKVQFVKTSYSTNEKSGAFSVTLMRTGDLSYTSTVRCYTRSMTAQVQRDFKERTDTDASIILFNPGETQKSCPVTIVDDLVFEGQETFKLKLGSADRNTRIGERNETEIAILDEADKPVIQFTKERVFVAGPVVRNAHVEARITLKKTGDPFTRSKVRVYTLDGSAKAGKGYQAMTQILEFSRGNSSHVVVVKILFDAQRKIRRAFTVHLSPDFTGHSELGRKKVIVYIEQPSRNPAVTFPLPPRVVSLRDYDDVSGAESEMIKGYPLICVTACDPKYPRYAETGSICSSQRINNKLTQFRWQIGEELRDLTSDTFFAKTDQVTLDSIYLVPGSRVRCVARAVNDRGELGLESRSAQVNISNQRGLCTPSGSDQVGSQQIEASISFTGATGNKYSNKVHIKVILPHTDGLIPLISTTRLANFKRILRPGVLRIAKHKCSNLLDLNEITTSLGFVADSIKDHKGMNEGEPYQFSEELRNNSTLRFYRNLDLESCLWTFNSYYDISELTQFCGATVTSDEQSSDIAQSQLTVRVPLYVSFVHRVPRTRGDWVHYDHAMFLRLHLTYDTAVLLNNGVQTPEGDLFYGELWPTAISVRADDKRLVVNFKTKTKFRGIYLIKNPSTEATAQVISRERPHLSFRLKLSSSQQTYNYPQQSWQFQSQYALRDYTGVYFIKLIPCTADEGAVYAEPLTCHPRDPVTFTLPIRFQQVPDPVPAKFTLSAKFFLMSQKDQWLDRVKMGDFKVDAAFSKGSKIYGRISLNEASGLGRRGKGYALATEKVYLCTGVGEYIPSYDPLKNKFGCMAKSLYLEHQLKVLDREEPSSVDKHLSDVPFEAKFAEEETNATEFSENPGSDGFVMNSAPLFEVPRNRKWFMHAIYSVTSGSRSRRALSVEQEIHSKTSFSSHVLSELDNSLVHRLFRRDAAGKRQIGVSGQGTNIKMIRLLLDPEEVQPDLPSKQIEKQTDTKESQDSSLVNPLVIGITAVCVVLLVALVVVGILFRRKLLTQQSLSAPTVKNSKEESIAQGGGVAV